MLFHIGLCLLLVNINYAFSITLPKTENTFRFQNRVYFKVNSTNISQQTRKIVSQWAEFLTIEKHLTVRLEGHADEIGKRNYNIHIAEQRADKVKNILVEMGISSKRVYTVSYGEERPDVSNCSPQLRSLNRKVDIIFLQ